MSSIRTIARRAKRRRTAAEVVRALGPALAAASGLALGLALIDRAIGPGVAWWLIPAGGVALGALGATAFTLARRRSLLASASQVDRALALHDRLSTGLALEQRDTAGDPFAALAVQQAQSLAERVSVRDAIPIRLGRSWAWWPVLTLSALAVGAWVPALDLLGAQSRQAARLNDLALREDAARELEQVLREATPARDAANDGARTDQLPEAAARELEVLDRLREELTRGTLTPDEARREAAQALDQAAQSSELAAEQDLRTDEEVRRALRGMGADGAGSEDSGAGGPAGELASALEQGDLEGARDAAERLDAARAGMSEQQRAESAATLERLSRDLRALAAQRESERADEARRAAERLEAQGVPSDLADPSTFDGAPEGEQEGASRGASGDATGGAPDVREALEKRGVDPLTADRIAREVAERRASDRAAREAVREAQDLAEAARRAAEQTRTGEANQSNQNESGATPPEESASREGGDAESQESSNQPSAGASGSKQSQAQQTEQPRTGAQEQSGAKPQQSATPGSTPPSDDGTRGIDPAAKPQDNNQAAQGERPSANGEQPRGSGDRSSGNPPQGSKPDASGAAQSGAKPEAGSESQNQPGAGASGSKEPQPQPGATGTKEAQPRRNEDGQSGSQSPQTQPQGAGSSAPGQAGERDPKQREQPSTSKNPDLASKPDSGSQPDPSGKPTATAKPEQGTDPKNPDGSSPGDASNGAQRDPAGSRPAPNPSQPGITPPSQDQNSQSPGSESNSDGRGGAPSGTPTPSPGQPDAGASQGQKRNPGDAGTQSTPGSSAGQGDSQTPGSGERSSGAKQPSGAGERQPGSATPGQPGAQQPGNANTMPSPGAGQPGQPGDNSNSTPGATPGTSPGTTPASSPGDSQDGAGSPRLPSEPPAGLSEQLRRMSERRDRAGKREQQSREMRERAKEMLDKMSPEERERWERWAQDMARERGSDQPPDSPDSPDSSAPPDAVGDAARRSEGESDNPRGGGERPGPRGAGNGRGTRGDPNGSGIPTAAEGTAENAPGTRTDVVDARTGAASDDDAEVIAEWYDPDARLPSDPALRGPGAAATLREAARGTEQAFEEQNIPLRYRNVMRYFNRAIERAAKEREAAAPPESAEPAQSRQTPAPAVAEPNTPPAPNSP